MPKNYYRETLGNVTEHAQTILNKAFDKTDEIVFQRFLEYIEFSIAGYKRSKTFTLPSRKQAINDLRNFVNIIKKIPENELSSQKKMDIIIGFLLSEQAKVSVSKKGGLRGVLLKENSFFKFYDDMLKHVVEPHLMPSYQEVFHKYQQQRGLLAKHENNLLNV